MSKLPPRLQKDINEYKDAVWAFLIEHCDVTDGGSFFFKFHASSRRNFEKRVWARYMYDYHREDWEEKNKNARKIRAKAKEKKERKREKYQLEKRKRRLEREQIYKMNEWVAWYNKTQRGSFLAQLVGKIASKTWKKPPSN